MHLAPILLIKINNFVHNHVYIPNYWGLSGKIKRVKNSEREKHSQLVDWAG
jgi:hypothetical protein